MALPSLLELLEKWLERTPVVSTANFDFIEKYKEILVRNQAKDVAIINENPRLNAEEKVKHQKKPGI